MFQLLSFLFLISVASMPIALAESVSEERLLEDFDESFVNEGEEFFDDDSRIKDKEDSGIGDTLESAMQYLHERFSGSLFGLRYRNEVQDAVGRSDINRLQYQLKLKMNLPIFGKYMKLKFEPQTGDDTWSSGWDDAFETGDESDPEFDMTLRRLYLQGHIFENFKYQVGAIPARPKRSMSTPLNVDTDGWVDGTRLSYYLPGKGLVKQVSATLGDIDFSDGDFYERSWDLGSDEFAQAQFDGYLLGTLSYNTEFNRLHEDHYSRVHFNLDLKSLTGLMETYVIFEEFVSLDDNTVFDSLGRSIGVLKKDVNWRAQIAFVDNGQSPTARLLTFGPARPEGKQLFFFYERRIFAENTVWFLRIRRCVENNICDHDYRAEFAIRHRL